MRAFCVCFEVFKYCKICQYKRNKVQEGQTKAICCVIKKVLVITKALILYNYEPYKTYMLEDGHYLTVYLFVIIKQLNLK